MTYNLSAMVHLYNNTIGLYNLDQFKQLLPQLHYFWIDYGLIRFVHVVVLDFVQLWINSALS